MKTRRSTKRAPKPSHSKYLRDGCGQRWMAKGIRHVCQVESRSTGTHFCPCGEQR